MTGELLDKIKQMRTKQAELMPVDDYNRLVYILGDNAPEEITPQIKDIVEKPIEELTEKRYNSILSEGKRPAKRETPEKEMPHFIFSEYNLVPRILELYRLIDNISLCRDRKDLVEIAFFNRLSKNHDILKHFSAKTAVDYEILRGKLPSLCAEIEELKKEIACLDKSRWLKIAKDSSKDLENVIGQQEIKIKTEIENQESLCRFIIEQYSTIWRKLTPEFNKLAEEKAEELYRAEFVNTLNLFMQQDLNLRLVKIDNYDQLKDLTTMIEEAISKTVKKRNDIDDTIDVGDTIVMTREASREYNHTKEGSMGTVLQVNGEEIYALFYKLTGEDNPRNPSNNDRYRVCREYARKIVDAKSKWYMYGLDNDKIIKEIAENISTRALKDISSLISIEKHKKEAKKEAIGFLSRKYETKESIISLILARDELTTDEKFERDIMSKVISKYSKKYDEELVLLREKEEDLQRKLDYIKGFIEIIDKQLT